MLRKILSLSLILALFLLTDLAFAKDLTHRLGIGFKNNTAYEMPSLSVIYYPTNEFALTAGAGVDTKKDESSSVFTGGARFIIYPETNMNFYVAGQAGFLSIETVADGRKNGLELDGVFGVEFFLVGLENLAFNFEAGAGFTTVNNSRFRTIGDSPLRAGMTFYF